MNKINNLCIVGDVDNSALSEKAYKFLSLFMTYQDNVLSEDLFNVADAIESDHFKKLEPSVQKELKDLCKEAGEKDCAYIRVIYEGQRGEPKKDPNELDEMNFQSSPEDL